MTGRQPSLASGPAHRRPRPRPPADGLQRLLEIQQQVVEEPELPKVLRHVVAGARELLGAGYGSVEIFGADETVEQAVATGAISGESAERLDVAVEVRGKVLGTLTLTDPETEHFDAAQQQVAATLARIAGVAIENSRLREESRRSRDWFAAAGEVARMLLRAPDGPIDPEGQDVLHAVTALAVGVAEADYAALLLPEQEDRLRVAAATGRAASVWEHFTFDPRESPLGRLVLAAEAIRVLDFVEWTTPPYENAFDFGPAMIAPLTGATGSRGALLVIRERARPAFTERDLQLTTTFAGQVALAIELDDARAEAAWLHVLEDRHRIAQDLHDVVMQRLFATGVGLQSLAETPLDFEVVNRLRQHVADLDETIDEIRGRIFGLRGDTLPETRQTFGPTTIRPDEPPNAPEQP